MNDMEPIQWNINLTNIKQTRVYVLCVLSLPNEVRDKMAAKDVLKAHGSFLLGFSVFPSVNEVFPYSEQMWKVKSVIQFPHRYKTRATKVSCNSST